MLLSLLDMVSDQKIVIGGIPENLENVEENVRKSWKSPDFAAKQQDPFRIHSKIGGRQSGLHQSC